MALWSADGLVAMGRAPLVTTHPAPGWAEQDPHAWLPSVVAACPAIDGPVEAIGFSSSRETWVPVTGSGEPVGPAIVWSDPRAGQGEAALDADRRAASRWSLAPRDLVLFQLTGVLATDWTIDSVSSCTRGPDVLRSCDIAGFLDTDVLGLPRGTPVVIGAGDRQCEVLGSGASPARPMVSWGTTANVSTPATGPTPAGLRRTRAALDGWLSEGGVSAAGSFLDWLSTLGIADDGESPPGANGVIAVPWLDGARAPWWRAEAGAAFLHLNSAHRGADLARAAVEAVAWEIDRCLTGAAPAGLCLAGGGTADRRWREILTGITGLPAQARRIPDAASVGAALIVSHALGSDWDADRLNPVTAEIVPDPAAVDAYAALRAASQRVADTLIGL